MSEWLYPTSPRIPRPTPTQPHTPAWAGSDRRARLPRDWAKRRLKVKARAGGQCEWVDGTRCQRPGNECDHIIPNDDHSLPNLQWLCTAHHKVKTQAEAKAATQRNKAAGHRAAERHPGQLR
jgi:5-methylcytosine-specific restriction protein A